MEIKDYGMISEKIARANILMSDAEKAKDKEVNDVIGSVKAKMESWLNETCHPLFNLETHEYEQQFEVRKYLQPHGIRQVSFEFESWNSLTIAIVTRNKDLCSREGLCYSLRFKQKHSGFKDYDNSVVPTYFSCDENVMTQIVAVWNEIKPFINKCVEVTMETAKEKIVSHAADIEKTMETLNALKNFEV